MDPATPPKSRHTLHIRDYQDVMKTAQTILHVLGDQELSVWESLGILEMVKSELIHKARNPEGNHPGEQE